MEPADLNHIVVMYLKILNGPVCKSIQTLVSLFSPFSTTVKLLYFISTSTFVVIYRSSWGLIKQLFLIFHQRLTLLPADLYGFLEPVSTSFFRLFFLPASLYHQPTDAATER